MYFILYHQFYITSIIMSQFPSGNAQHPINIDNDEEDQVNFKDLLQAARNKTLIQEAQITNEPLELCFAVAKTAVKGELETKNRQVNKAILNYFQQRINIKISHQFFYPRPEPDYSDIEGLLNLQQLIIYGVDFLTTNAIKNRLQTLNTQIQQIIWINGSTCKVICRSQIQADRIIKNQLKQIKIQQDSQSFKSWHSIAPYMIFSFQRPLFLRFSLINQQFIADKTNQKFQQFLQAKKELPLHLLQKFNAVQKYKQVVKDIHMKTINRKKNYRFNQRDRQYSRSRQRNRPNFKKQKQQQQIHENRYRKKDRFTDNGSYQQVKQIKYAHQPIRNNEQDSISIPEPTYQKRQKINTDYNLPNNFNQKNSSLLNTSFTNKNKQKSIQQLILYDHLSEADSNLSFNYQNLAIGMNKQDENRLDYHYSQHQSNSNNDDLQYQLAQPPKKNTLNSSFIMDQKKAKKKIDETESFIEKSKAYHQQPQSSDFFDFDQNLHPNKLKNQTTLNSSFCIEPKESKSKKPISNFNDDYSY